MRAYRCAADRVIVPRYDKLWLATERLLLKDVLHVRCFKASRCRTDQLWRDELVLRASSLFDSRLEFEELILGVLAIVVRRAGAQVAASCHRAALTC